MFKSARIKLTIWYLLIIMSISLAFSAFIYTRVCQELERGFKRIELRHKAEEMGIALPRFLPRTPLDLPLRLRDISPRYFFAEDFEEAKKRVFLNLLLINGVILGFSALAGYFLAGKTLCPIEKALEEQKRFVTDASHELRTPLTALKTSMEVALRDKKISLSEAKKVIKTNLEDINSLGSLANNLLNLANYQSNNQKPDFEKINLDDALKNVSRKILPLVKEKNLDLKVESNRVILFADGGALEEMLLIFLDNAVKYTPKGGKIKLITKTEKKNLIIKVEDSGIGISKEDLPQIFDRFYRADQSRSKGNVPGFGLGLSLAKKIIMLHRGSVEVESTLGKGTTFTIKLPFKHS